MLASTLPGVVWAWSVLASRVDVESEPVAVFSSVRFPSRACREAGDFPPVRVAVALLAGLLGVSPFASACVSTLEKGFPFDAAAGDCAETPADGRGALGVTTGSAGR